MGIQPLFGKSCFFDFFCARKLAGLEKTFLAEKHLLTFPKTLEIQVVFSEHVRGVTLVIKWFNAHILAHDRGSLD